jgi:hypothetical protein
LYHDATNIVVIGRLVGDEGAVVIEAAVGHEHVEVLSSRPAAPVRVATCHAGNHMTDNVSYDVGTRAGEQDIAVFQTPRAARPGPLGAVPPRSTVSAPTPIARERRPWASTSRTLRRCR